MDLNTSEGESKPRDLQVRALRTVPSPSPERATVASLTEQLALARADAARLIDSLAEAYMLHARKSADAVQWREEVIAASKQLALLEGENAMLRESNHRLMKEHGELRSRVSSLRENITAQAESAAALAREADNARAALASQEAQAEALRTELERRLRDALSAQTDLTNELSDTTEQFLSFVNEAREERRREVQALSGLIDAAQNGRAWRVKRFLRKLWRK